MVRIRTPNTVPGLSFSRLKGTPDYEMMSDISQKSWLADGFEWMQTPEDIAVAFDREAGRDPSKDILLIEIGSEVVGFGEIRVERIGADEVILWNQVHLLPEWRGRGIREAVFEFNEKELRKRLQGTSSKSSFQVWASDEPNDWKSIVLANRFAPTWHVLEMVRPNLDDLPNFALPNGLEMRQVTPNDYRQVWDGMREAYRTEPWFAESKFDEASYKEWVDSRDFCPELWQAAWSGDRIAGIVQNFVSDKENETFGRKRGHTERIFVVPEWQRKGVARALISKSLDKLREIGMSEATLDVAAENVSGALRLYESLGYKTVQHFTFYRKSVEQ